MLRCSQFVLVKVHSSSMLFTHGRVYRHSQIYTDSAHSGVCFALKADGTHFSQMAEFGGSGARSLGKFAALV